MAAVRTDPTIRGGAYWGVVVGADASRPTSTGSKPATFACDPNGRVLVSMQNADETILYVDVPLRVVMSDARANSGTHGGHAD